MKPRDVEAAYDAAINFLEFDELSYEKVISARGLNALCKNSKEVEGLMKERPCCALLLEEN